MKSIARKKNARTKEETTTPESGPNIRAVDIPTRYGDEIEPHDIEYRACEALLYGGLQNAADDLEIIEGYMLGGGGQNDPDIFMHAMWGVKTRLRVLAELSRRMLNDQEGLAAIGAKAVQP